MVFNLGTKAYRWQVKMKQNLVKECEVNNKWKEFEYHIMCTVVLTFMAGISLLQHPLQKKWVTFPSCLGNCHSHLNESGTDINRLTIQDWRIVKTLIQAFQKPKYLQFISM